MTNKEFAEACVSFLEENPTLLTKEEVLNLTTTAPFGSFPILKKITTSVEADRLVNGSSRYYSNTTIKLYDEEYLITSEWYWDTASKNRPRFASWLINKAKQNGILEADIPQKILDGQIVRGEAPIPETQIRDTEQNEQQEDAKEICYSKIFFGAPGTGKSFKVNEAVQNQQVFRTTFHPDYDYAQFVGAYKPKKDGEKITYSFVPQVFAKAYAAAWKLYLRRDSRLRGNDNGNGENDNENGGNEKDIQVYLVIEEINRGNCAQIFGDIFQLLDRNSEGFSQYSIDADCDFATWLKEDSVLKTVWSDYEAKVGDGKLKLPPNLNILATMNTSDQSLFPMDSAFKRRFDWEYVPINYDHSEAGFIIEIGDSKYMWLDFLKKVNADIYDATQSEDKQMGEFFIKPKSDDLKIAFNEFRSKVLFYLWDSVYKDETERQAVFHFPYGDGDGKINSVTFQSLFGKDAEAIVNKIMENLKVEKVTA